MTNGQSRFSWRTLPALLAGLLLLHAQAVSACIPPAGMEAMPCCPEQHASPAGTPAPECADQAVGDALCAKPYAPVAGQVTVAVQDKSAPDAHPAGPDFDPALIHDTDALSSALLSAPPGYAVLGDAFQGTGGRLTYLTTLRLRL